MKTLIFAGKGGGGKTTLISNLGIVAREHGWRVGLADADGQHTLCDWRMARGSADIPLRSCRPDQVREVCELAARAGLDRLLIDMSPAIEARTPAALARADLVLLPMRPAMFDLGATRQWIALLRSTNTDCGVLINAAPPRRLGTDAPAVRDARVALGDLHVPVWRGQITRREMISTTAIGGRGVVETDPHGPAAAEYRALWRAIDRTLDPNRRITNGHKPTPHAA